MKRKKKRLNKALTPTNIIKPRSVTLDGIELRQKIAAVEMSLSSTGQPPIVKLILASRYVEITSNGDVVILTQTRRRESS